MKQRLQPGTEITVACGQDRYRTVVGADGTQRFVGNGAVIHLASGLGGPEAALSHVLAEVRADRHAYGARDLAAFMALLGLPVSEASSELLHESVRVVSPAPPVEETRRLAVDDGPQPYRTVTVDGVPFQATVARSATDVPRFEGNRVVAYLASPANPGRLTPSQMHDAFRSGAFAKADYVAYQALLEIPVAALAAIPGLDDCEVLWPEVPMPDASFEAKVATDARGRFFPLRQAAGIPGVLGDEVLDATPLAGVEYGDLFAYMYRRFGPPTVQTDNHDDLAGGWLIDTPDPQVFLSVKASLVGAWHGIVPYLVVRDPADHPKDLLPPGRAEEAKAAYRAALLDLLRPVGVRDSQFNALGHVGDDDPLLEEDDLDDDSPGYGLMAEAHPAAGFAAPPGMLGNDQWGRLLAVTSRLGGGDHAAGLEALVDMGMDLALSEAAAEPSDVRVILAAGMYGKGEDEVLARLALSPWETALVEGLVATFRSGKPRDGFEVPDLSQADMDRARRIAGWLGLRHEFAEPYRRYRFGQRVRRTLTSLVSEFGRELPDECEPDLGRWGIVTDDALRAYPDFLRARGLDGMADWADRLLAEEDGDAVLSRVMTTLRAWGEASRKRAAESEPPADGLPTP